MVHKNIAGCSSAAGTQVWIESPEFSPLTTGNHLDLWNFLLVGNSIKMFQSTNQDTLWHFDSVLWKVAIYSRFVH